MSLNVMADIATDTKNDINNFSNLNHLFNAIDLLNILLQTKLHSLNELSFTKIQVKIDAQIYTLTLKNMAEFQIKEANFSHTTIDLVGTDSRIDVQTLAKTQQLNLEKPNINGLFIALVGENMDAHAYMHDLKNKGYQIAITERIVENCDLPQIIVPNTLQALQMLAKGHRQSLDMPVVAVLGSNGKTTTKEMLAHLFKLNLTHAFATQGNLNNHIGVPLSLLRIRPYHQAAVLEIGMNHIGETSILAEMVAPDVSIITNAQREHQEFMLNVENVAREHALIAEFTKKMLIVPYQPEFLEIWQNAAKTQQIECHVFAQSIDIPINLKNQLTSYSTFEFANINQKSAENTTDPITPALYRLHLTSQLNLGSQKQALIDLNLMGTHNAYNATAVWAAFHTLGFDMSKISASFTSYFGFKGRLQMLQQNPWVIDDTYNANPDSVLAAIAAVSELRKNLEKANESTIQSLCILGDMGEVGEDGALYHQEIGQKAYTVFDGLITVGSLSKASSDAWNDLNSDTAKNQALHFTDHQTALDFLMKHQQQYQLFLLKGSRFMKMERLLATWPMLDKKI